MHRIHGKPNKNKGATTIHNVIEEPHSGGKKVLYDDVRKG